MAGYVHSYHAHDGQSSMSTTAPSLSTSQSSSISSATPFPRNGFKAERNLETRWRFPSRCGPEEVAVEEASAPAENDEEESAAAADCNRPWVGRDELDGMGLRKAGSRSLIIEGEPSEDDRWG